MNILTEDQSVHFEKSQRVLYHTYKKDRVFLWENTKNVLPITIIHSISKSWCVNYCK